MRRGLELRLPAGEIGGDLAQRGARLRLQLVGLGELGGGLQQRHAQRARGRAWIWRIAASPMPRLGTLTMRSKARSSAPCATTRKIGQRVADFLALVEARAADDAVVEAERDEAVLEGAHLEGGAHQDRHVVERVALALELLDLLADGARLLLRVPGGEDDDLGVLGIVAVGEQRLAEPALVVGDEMRGGAEDVRGRAVVALQADDGGARKILLEAQDVVDLGAAPAIDRLVVVADAADVYAFAPGVRLRRRGPAGRRTGRLRPSAVCRLSCGGLLGRCASSRSHRYCATLVSWYSSTRM